MLPAPAAHGGDGLRVAGILNLNAGKTNRWSGRKYRPSNALLHRMKHPSTAFTLIEILVATAVLVLMLTMVTGLVNSATRSTQTAERRLDGMADVRMVFDRMASDLQSLVSDGDTTLIVGKSPAPSLSDSMAFVTRARTTAAPAESRLATVLYAIGEHNNEVFGAGEKTLMLTRLLQNYAWEEATPLAKFLSDTDAQLLGAGPDTLSFNALGETIIRMAVAVHKSDGTLVHTTSNNLPRLASFSGSTARITSGDSTALDLSQVDAITVAIASIDARSQVLTADQLETIAQALPRASADGTLPLAQWNSVNWDQVGGIIPSVVRENIRFYQRTFPIMPQ
jgi:type II secretory pathway pseudopilin PulG